MRTVATVVQTSTEVDQKTGSIGFPFSGFCFRIVDPKDNHKDMPIGDDGEWREFRSFLLKTATGRILIGEEAAKPEAAGIKPEIS